MSIRYTVTDLPTPKIGRKDHNALYLVTFEKNLGEGWVPYERMTHKWTARRVVQLQYGGDKKIVEKDSKDFMWYSYYFARVEKVGDGQYEVHVIQEWLD